MIPTAFPAPPKRALSGFNMFTEEKKKEFEQLMPESQKDEIAGIINKEWTKLTTDEKQDYEEKAYPD